MRREIFRFLFAMGLYYLITICAGDVLVMPSEIIRFSTFLPPILGLMWGPVAAAGTMCGELLANHTAWYALPDIFRQKGFASCFWHAFLLFCSNGLWAFLAAYMPYRLWHSILVHPVRPLFSLRTDILLKFVYVVFLTTLTTSLLLAISTDSGLLAQQLEESTLSFGRVFEYAFLCFINDFNVAIFFGLIWFFILISFRYPFYRPLGMKTYHPKLQREFDLIFLIGCATSLVLCLPDIETMDALRLGAILMLCLYPFRPLSPLPKYTRPPKQANFPGNAKANRIALALFYSFFLLLFLLLDVSGTIYDLANLDTWLQFNGECLTMMNLGLIAILYLLLRHRSSIMVNFVFLEVITVFISAFVLGWVCFVVTNRITEHNLENSLEEMSVICRERIKRTFDGIQVSVNAIHDLAKDEIKDYEQLRNNEEYRSDYLARTEYLFKSIASNTAGSIAFYLRCDPGYAGPLGGFSWGREPNRWEGATSDFRKRTPVDLSNYSPDDYENVGWYYIPIERHRATWIEPYMDPAAESYVVSYVSPLYFEKNLVGVVGMDIDFDYIIHEVRRMSVYHHGHVYLTDRSGRVLYHQDYAQGELFRPNPTFHEKETYLTNGIWLGVAMPMREIYAERNNLLMHLTSVMLAVAILGSILSISLAAKGIRPLLSLTEATKRIAAGNLDVKLPQGSDNELGALIQSVHEMVAKLEIYVYRDKLTGLRNTAAYARQCSDLATQEGNPYFHYAVVVFDVNFLKLVNDQYGHEAGNELICCAAKTISKVFAQSHSFRIGGDEFAAILRDDDYMHRDELLEAFDEAVSAAGFTVQGTFLPLSIARGMAVYRPGMDYAAVFQQADEAMYAHKAILKKHAGMDLR